MNTRPNAKERIHLAHIKEMACVVCGAPGPSLAHHVRQKSAYYCVPLCESCHVGPLMGIHGQRRAWALAKLDEMDALALTVQQLSEKA